VIIKRLFFNISHERSKKSSFLTIQNDLQNTVMITISPEQTYEKVT